MLYAVLASGVVSALGIVFFLQSRLASIIADVPNTRSLHTKVTPRIGGIGLMVGIAVGWAISGAIILHIALAAALLFFVSLLDDKYCLPVRGRLAIHFITAAVLVGWLDWPEGMAGILLALLSIFAAVWMTNLYNFMDGSDGLAGGMAVWGFGFYGIAALLGNANDFAVLNLCVASAAAGFLVHNFHPAKVFMGDAGSIPLGFLAAAMGIWGWREAIWPAWFPFLLFSPFIIDATLTLLKRLIRGARVTEAHREHYYQRAIQMGSGHRNLALFEYLLMILVGGTGLLSLQQPFPWALMVAWGVVFAILMRYVDKRWLRFLQASRK